MTLKPEHVRASIKVRAADVLVGDYIPVLDGMLAILRRVTGTRRSETNVGIETVGPDGKESRAIEVSEKTVVNVISELLVDGQKLRRIEHPERARIAVFVAIPEE